MVFELNEVNFQRNSIQLDSVELLEIKFSNTKEDGKEYKNLPFGLKRAVEIEGDFAYIFLKARIGEEEESGFTMNIEYKGKVTRINESINLEELKQYSFDHVIPMLLPYIRETLSSILNRTDLPHFMLPTMDVINYLKTNYEEANKDD